MDEINKNTLKVLIIGDCNIGKTSLLLKYMLSNNEDEKKDSLCTYKPTTLSIYKCQVEINSKVHDILFTDHNGNSDDDDHKLSELRKHSYIYDKVTKLFLFFSNVLFYSRFSAELERACINITVAFLSSIKN